MIKDLLNNQEPFLIDTSILVSAMLSKEKKDRRAIAAKIVSDGINRAAIMESSLIEFISVVYMPHKQPLKKQDVEEVAIIVKDFESVYKVFCPSKQAINQAIMLSFTKKIDYNVALLAQTMLDSNIRLIYTEKQKEFNKIPGIKAINPFIGKNCKKEASSKK